MSADGLGVLFTAPVEGSFELWRVPLAGGADPERLTTDRHYLSGWDAVAVDGRDVVVAVRSTATELPEVVVLRSTWWLPAERARLPAWRGRARGSSGP